MKKLIMLIGAISLLPAYIFAAGDVLSDEKLDKAISQKVENAKKQKEEKEYMKAPAYIGMRKYIDKDDGDGLRKYIANYHKSGKHITEDDFYDIYEVKKGAYNKYVPVGVSLGGEVKQHKLCYAIAYNKVNAGKAIIDAGQYPKEGCRKYEGKNKIYSLNMNRKEVSLWKDENLDSKVQGNFPVDMKFTISGNEELTCYALEKGVIPREWLLNDKLPAPALCKEEWELPLKILKKKKAEEEARAKAEAEAKALAERARMLAEMGVSEEKWQELMEQKEDEFSFAKQSMDVLSKLLLLDYNKSSLNEKKDSYNKAIKDLDKAYKKYVKNSGGISVPKTAKGNYELTKQTLIDGIAQLEQRIAEENEQKKIAAKKAAEAKEEKFRKNFLKAFKGNEEKAEIFFEPVSKNIDKSKGFNAMYFPNGGKVCFTWSLHYEPDCTEYITPILVVYQVIEWTGYSDGPIEKEILYWGHNVYIYNVEGKLIEKKEKNNRWP